MDDLLPIPTPLALKTECHDEKMDIPDLHPSEDEEMSYEVHIIKKAEDSIDELMEPCVIESEVMLKMKPKRKKKLKPPPQTIVGETSGKKGKPIPGMAREIVLKVAEVCEQEYKDGFSKFHTSAPTKRACAYTGVSASTIRRIRVENNLNRSKDKMGEDCKDISGKDIKIKKEKEDYESKNKSEIKRATIPNSARDIICKVIAACDKEAEEGCILIPFISKTKRVALYTGISESTIKRIKIEDRVRNKVNPDKTLPRPGNIRKRATCDEKLDDYDLQVIRREIDSYTIVKKSYLSIATLLNSVKEKINVKFCKGTLWRLLKKKGYEFRKVPGEKSGKVGKIISEKPDISEARLSFLKSLTEYEAEGRVVVYLDDITFSSQDEDREKCEIDIAQKTSCSERLILLHDHSANQIVKKVQILFKPNSIDSVMAPKPKCMVTPDYVEKWFKSQVFPNIPANSVIVMPIPPKEKRDKDSKKVPKKCSSKPVIVNYLKDNNIPFDPNLSKEQLYKIVRKNTATSGRLEPREIDKIVRANGHLVLWLPQCLSEFHPMSLAWSDIKRFIRSKQNPKSRFNHEALKLVTYEALSLFNQDTWQGYVSHIVEMEHYYWEKRELIREHINEVRKWALDEATMNDTINEIKKDSSATVDVVVEQVATTVSTETNTENNNKHYKVVKDFGTQTDPNDLKFLGVPSDAIIIENHATNTISIQTNGTNINNIPIVFATQPSTNIQKHYEAIPIEGYHFNSWYNRHITDSVAGTSQTATLTPVAIDPRQIDGNLTGVNSQKSWIDLCAVGYDTSKATIVQSSSGGQIQNSVGTHLTNL